MLREASFELALLRGVLKWQLEKLQAGEWDVLKAKDLPEDPATWLIHQGELVIDSIAKVACLTFSDEIRAAMTLLEPALKLIQDAIHALVPAEVKPALLETIRTGLAKIVVPTGV